MFGSTSGQQQQPAAPVHTIPADILTMNREDLMQQLAALRAENSQLRATMNHHGLAPNAAGGVGRHSVVNNNATGAMSGSFAGPIDHEDASDPNAGLAPAGGAEGAVTTPYYSVSMNVLMVSGTRNSRRCRTVPLQAVLDRCTDHSYEYDADTPVAQLRDAHGNPYARHSVDLTQGRLSGFGSGAAGNAANGATGGFDFDGSAEEPTRLSTLGGAAAAAAASGATPTDSNGANGTNGDAEGAPAGTIAHVRPQPLNPGVMFRAPRAPLDPDALVSNNTLSAFTRNYADVPLSPQSSTATLILRYLLENFAKNDFAHDAPVKTMEALGRSLIAICTECERIVADEPAHPTVASPVYVFGDIHGNFRDLHYFVSTIMNFNDMRFVPLNMMFLGDYVDRGDHGVEVVAFLFALKVLAPNKVTLLRGNHEDTLVNGDLNLYRETSFRYQCRHLFGDLLGEEVWSRCNRVFSFLPLTANIDNKIFCTHGGLPRYNGGADHRMNMLRSAEMPRMESFFQVPENESRDHAAFRQMACDVCWSDPAEDERMVDGHGFGNNPRGAGVILFGSKAVDKFLTDHGFEYIFRAHQEKADGLKISKNARVVTVFSTSGYVGHQNGAGVVFVNEGRIRLIIKEADGDGEE
jgi:protein phosphatase